MNTSLSKNLYLISRLVTFFLLFIVSITTYATTTNANSSDSVSEITESRKCCYPNGISYCDATAGHYVCNDGGYSACLCTNTAPVSTYRQLALGCCTWHGGVVASTLGQVVCADGSLSEICSLQTAQAASISPF